MTLTAIDREHRLFNPSAQIDAGAPESAVVDDMREMTRLGLYCPHCFRKTAQLVPVRFRNPKERRKHFFHLDSVESGKECGHYSRESELHMEAKTSLAEWLRFQNPLAKVELEKLLVEDEVKRKPDIAVTYLVGTKEAHEIQISFINSSGLANRSVDLKELGYVPIWYLYGKNWTRENREYLRSVGIQCYRLFRGDDKFEWELDTRQDPPAKTAIGGRLDSCGRRFKKLAGSELHSAEWAVSSFDVDLDCYVRHSFDYVQKHEWIGQVVWVSSDWVLADVRWLIWPVGHTPPRTSDPQRYPIRLLERMECIHV